MSRQSHQSGQFQDRGHRSYQEDRCLSLHHRGSNFEISLIAVADGMGATSNGDIAAQLSIDSLKVFWDKLVIQKSFNWDLVLDNLESSIRNINVSIKKYSELNGTDGMGTTLTCAIIYQHEMVVFHVGDTRLYIYENEQLLQITKDHTALQDAIDRNIDVSKVNIGLNAIYNCLDGSNDLKIDCYPNSDLKLDVEQKTVLICSDGLYGVVSDRDIANIISSSSDLNKLSQNLVLTAKKQNSRDNISAVIFSHGVKSTKRAKKVFFSGAFSPIMVMTFAIFIVLGLGTFIITDELGYSSKRELLTLDHNRVDTLSIPDSTWIDNSRPINTPGTLESVVIPKGLNISSDRESYEVYHTVQPHETLVSLQSKYQNRVTRLLTLDEIKQVNNLTSISLIFPGQRLIIGYNNVETAIRNGNQSSATSDYEFPEVKIKNETIRINLEDENTLDRFEVEGIDSMINAADTSLRKIEIMLPVISDSLSNLPAVIELSPALPDSIQLVPKDTIGTYNNQQPTLIIPDSSLQINNPILY